MTETNMQNNSGANMQNNSGANTQNNSENNYDVLSKYYDDMVTKNRDYKSVAESLSVLFKDKKKILEIGVGTGLALEELLKLDPDYEIWGVDNSEPLLVQAQERLASYGRAHLHLQDMREMELDQEFEVIYSRGGAIFFVESSEGYSLASHLPSQADNLKAIKNMARHLQTSGLFILSATQYTEHTKELSYGVLHHRQVYQQMENDQNYLILDFTFKKDDHIIDQQILKILMTPYQLAEKMFAEAGLHLIDRSSHVNYFVFQKLDP